MERVIALIGIGMLLSAAILASPTESLAQRTGAPAMRAHQASGVLIGKPIRTEKGVVLGKVENIVLTDQGCARYVILSGSFPRAHGRLYPIPWDMIARVDREAFFVDIDPAVLVEAPSFTAGRWPDFAQAQWDTRVSEFFRSHNRANAPAGTGAKEEQNLQRQRSLQQQQVTPGKQGTEKPPVSREERMKSGTQMERERKALEMKKQGQSGQRQMEMMRQHEPGKSGEQHGVTGERTLQRTPEKTMEHVQPGTMGQQHMQPGTMGQQHTPSAQPGQGVPKQEHEIK